jgi:hypothetical protein
MGLQLEGAPALSRRRFFQGAAAVAAGASGSLALPTRSAASSDGGDGGGLRDVVPPEPIPGGIQIPGGPQIHVWAAGDPNVTLPFSGATLQGLDVDLTTIRDFRGFSAVAFHAGTVKGSDGATYNLETDMRVFRGKYVSADGTRRFGTFGFV